MKRSGERRAIGAALLALALAGCSPEGSGGVHVVVALDEALFGGELVFDHIELTAEGAGKRATVCLFPAHDVLREIALPDAEATCADAHTAAWTGSPTLTAWAFSERSRRVNFVFEDGDDVAITAAARFGGAPTVVASGRAEVTAAPEFPKVTLELTPGSPAILPACDVALQPVLPDFFDLQETGLCKRDASSCPQEELSESRSGEALRCVRAASRAMNAPGLVCADAGDVGPSVVWRAAPRPRTEACVFILATGHFVRCASGSASDPSGCELTTACLRPATAFAVLSGTSVLDGSVADISCVPPFPVPLTFSMTLPLPVQGEAAIALLQDPQGAAAEGACFFDIYSVAEKDVPCGP